MVKKPVQTTEQAKRIRQRVSNSLISQVPDFLGKDVLTHMHTQVFDHRDHQFSLCRNGFPGTVL